MLRQRYSTPSPGRHCPARAFAPQESRSVTPWLDYGNLGKTVHERDRCAIVIVGRAAVEHAAVDYLLKPVDAARLMRAYERLQARLAGSFGAGGEATAGDGADGATAPTTGDAAPSALDLALEQLRRLAAFAPVAGAALRRLRLLQAAVGSTIHFVPVDEVIYFEAADK